MNRTLNFPVILFCRYYHDALQHPIQALASVVWLSTGVTVSSTVHSEFAAYARPSEYTRELARTRPYAHGVAQQAEPVVYGGG